MNRLRVLSYLCFATGLVASCGVSDDDGSIEPGGATEPGVCSKMDILFVIDDSSSMGEEQDNLAANFPKFIEVLDNFMVDSGTIDYRVAVTTTGRDVNYTLAVEPVTIPGVPPSPFPPITPIPNNEKGANGALQQKCGMTQPWLSRGDSGIASTFSCVAKVGTDGPVLEMPLLTTQMALSDRITDGTNAGFLREDALLGIVVITDEDDCSRRDNNFEIANEYCGVGNADYMPPSETVAFLDDLTGDRGRWATAVIAGADNNCSSEAFGDAYKAENLLDFVSQAGANGGFSSICSGDLATPLQEALANL